jgi:hypothetical protein
MFGRGVGWHLEGIRGRTGEIKFAWQEGGFFLIQHFNLVYGGRKIRGIEVIGNLRRVGEEPSKEIWTRVYTFDGLTLDYVYELVDRNLTIWFGERGSQNFFLGKFSDDGKTLSGAWQWPGGGYSVTNAKIS